MRLSRLAAPAVLALLAFAAPSSRAAVAGDTGEIEVFAGWYWPEDNNNNNNDNLDNWTAGVRGGYNFTQHFGMGLGIQGFRTDFDTTLVGPPAFTFNTDVDAWLSDLSFIWMVNPKNTAVFQVYGGPGYSWSTLDFNLPAVKNDDDDVWTAHLGVGVKIGIGKRFFIHPDARYRWFDSDERNDDHGDWEATVGAGWYLGKNVINANNSLH